MPGMVREFAETYGSPGERPRIAGIMQALWPLMIALFLAGYLIRAAWPSPAISGVAVGALLLILALLVAVSVFLIQKRFGAFLKGAHGEETVARALAFLPPTYRVFHGLTAPGTSDASPRTDFDHVVVGPTGLYLVETKSWSGRMTIVENQLLYDGKHPTRAPLPQVRHGARQLAEALQPTIGRELYVQPVICSALDTVREHRLTADGVIICNAREITSVIREPGDERLSSADIEQVAATLTSLA